MKFIPLLFICHLAFSMTNLIWQGDFESYSQPSISTSTYRYETIPSNASGWYNPNGPIEIKKMNNPLTTKAIDLSTIAPYILCQRLNLKPGSVYRLSFQMYTEQRLQRMTGTASLNGFLISKVYIDQNNSFGKNISFFSAQSQFNELCFQQSHSVVNPSINGNLYMIGGLVDNISLYQVQNFKIKFTLSIDQVNNIIFLKSDCNLLIEFIDQFKKRYILQIFGSQLKVQYSIQEDGLLLMRVSHENSLVMDELIISQNQTYISNLSQLVNFNISISYSEQYFYSLTEKEISFLSEVKPILLSITKAIGKVVFFSKSFFCSYFILSLIAFENLSLYYIFLNIKILPQFSKSLYYEMLKAYFQQSSVLSWVQHQFSLKENPVQIRQEIQNIPETLEERRSGMLWFGQFGFSSLVWSNNSQGFLLLVFLGLKMIFVKTVMKFVNLSKFGVKLRKRDIIIAFLVEFLAMVPNITVSAFHQMLTSVCDYLTFIEKSIQICLFFMCFSGITIYRLSYERQKYHTKKNPPQKKMHGKNKQKINKDKKPNKPIGILKKTGFLNPKHLTSAKFKSKIVKQSANLKKKLKRRYNSVSNLILAISISSLIILNSKKIFFSTVGLTIVFKTAQQHIQSKFQAITKKLMIWLTNFVWFVHHFVFIAFYVIDVLVEEYPQSFQKYQKNVIILGIFAIFTVVIGSVLEIGKMAIEWLEDFVNLVKAIVKWRKGQEIVPKEVLLFNKNKKQRFGSREKEKPKGMNQITPYKVHKAEKKRKNQVRQGLSRFSVNIFPIVKIKKQREERLLIRLRVKDAMEK